MYRTTFIVLVLAFVLPDAHAQVPHIFQPNQPARAAEVNENFTALANGLSSIDGRLTYVEQSTSAGSKFFPVGQVQLPVGSKVTVGGTVYTIVQLRVPRFDTDETWLLRFPTSDPDLGGSGQRDGEGVRLSVTGINPARPMALQRGAYHTELNGFNAHINQTLEYWHYNQGSAWSRWNSTDFFQVTRIEIELGPETLVHLELWGDGMKSVSGTSDMSSGIMANPTFPFVPRSDIRNSNWRAHDELLSYVWLER